MSLFRVWYFTQNDRREIARFKAEDYGDVEDYLLNNFIKPEHRKDVDIFEWGIGWDDGDPKECLKYVEAEDLSEDELEEYNSGEYNPCEYCYEGCGAGFQIEEDEWGYEHEFKTIYGTNEYYDLTGPYYKVVKSDDRMIQHNYVGHIGKLVNNRAYKEDMLTLDFGTHGIQNFYLSEVEKISEKAEDWDPRLSSAWKKDPETGVAALLLSSATPREALSDELYERSKEKLKEME